MPEALRRYVPNALTVLRVFLAGAFFMALNAYRYPHIQVMWANIANALFVAAAVTDALDGYLARKWKVESLFGRLMDPFCDKVLIIGAFMYLTGPRFVMAEEKDGGEIIIRMASGVYPWMVVLILARELLVTGIRGIVESQGVSFASQWSGKAKMILQSISIPIVLALVANLPPRLNPPENIWVLRVCEVVVYLTVAVTVWSGLPYIFGLRKMLAQKTFKSAAES
jgi:CDP-diacylglycerol--glycerol-3-phosphate 3-phosphatidyltransferase